MQGKARQSKPGNPDVSWLGGWGYKRGQKEKVKSESNCTLGLPKIILTLLHPIWGLDGIDRDCQQIVYFGQWGQSDEPNC